VICDFKQTFTARSIILTTLLGGRVNFANLLGDAGYYADAPTALVHIVSDLDTYLQANRYMPVISDPGGTGEDLSHRWDQAQYENFRSRIHGYSELMSEALSEADTEKSERLWQRIFGPSFTAPRIEKRALLLEAASPSPREQFLDRDFGISYRPRGCRLRIIGNVGSKPGFRTYDLPKQGNRVLKGRALTFRIARCDVPAPYEVYWKVRNRGTEAADRQQLRGEITQGGNTKVESTLYRGSHWVECYIVKNGVCVARDHHPVIIR
jgi:Adenylyl/Guanylyl and SMODS C-terminal sensor domain